MQWYELELFILFKEELCQCPDCQKFYKEHDRFIREFPTFKQQQELNWASIQSFRTLCSKVTEVLNNQLSDKDFKINLLKIIIIFFEYRNYRCNRITWKFKCLFILYGGFNGEDFWY